MNDNIGTVADLKALLEHTAWLSRLAAHLVGGRGDPEDLAQETWLSALRARPGEVGHPRAWLARVLRGRVLRRARGEARRRAREQRAQALASDQVEPEAGALERLELQRMLTELVTALPEPFRSTVVMRYLEERTAADIARSLGVPEGTVRWRTREALGRLRAALDERQNATTPPGPSWRRALAALPPADQAQLGDSSGRRSADLSPSSALGLAGGVAAVGVTAIFLLLPPRPPGTPAPAQAVHAGPRAAGSPRGRSATVPEVVLSTYAAVAGGQRSPSVQLADAEERWRESCGSPTDLDVGNGLCLRAVAAAGDLCPQARAAGIRLEAVARDEAASAAARRGFAQVLADPHVLRTEQALATLRLAESAFEQILAQPPLTGLVLDLHRDSAAFARDNQRMSDWMKVFGTALKTTARDFERLAESIGVVPEIAVVARLRLAELYLAAGRLKLATEIPSGLQPRNQRGQDQRRMFCDQLAGRADMLFDRAFASLRECLRTPETARVAGVATRCQRLIEALPARTPSPP